MMTCLIGLPFIKYIMGDGVCRAELSGPSECRMVKERQEDQMNVYCLKSHHEKL